MRRLLAWILLCAITAFGLVMAQSEERGKTLPQGSPQSPPARPRSLPAPPKEAPLLLEDGAPAIEAQTGSAADNSRCQVCHLGLFLEEISVTHARASIGCAKCHGDCDEHIADESWASGGKGTAPQMMYPRHKVDPMCRACHKEARTAPPQPGKPCPALSSRLTTQKTCTECHGSHRQANRRSTWK